MINKPLAQRTYELVPSEDEVSSDNQINKENKKKKIKKEKKDKKDKKKSKDKKMKLNYGKYGLVTMSDMSIKRDEFVLWLSDVKKVCVDNISHVEERKYFEQFAEDFNTSSFPSKKYYNLDKYMKKNRKNIEEENNKSKTFQQLSDEQQKLKGRQDQRDMMRQYQINDALYQLTNTADMANKMMEQQKLKDIMVHHYKMGNINEAKKIQHLLEGQKKEVNIKLDDDDPDVFD